MLVRTWAKWFSGFIFCFYATWDMFCSWMPCVCSHIFVILLEPFSLNWLLSGRLCWAVWETHCVHFGTISNCNNVFWGRDLSLHVHELWAAKQQTLRPELHYRTQCPLCVRKQPAAKELCWVFQTSVTTNPKPQNHDTDKTTTSQAWALSLLTILKLSPREVKFKMISELMISN